MTHTCYSIQTNTPDQDAYLSRCASGCGVALLDDLLVVPMTTDRRPRPTGLAMWHISHHYFLWTAATRCPLQSVLFSQIKLARALSFSVHLTCRTRLFTLLDVPFIMRKPIGWQQTVGIG